MDKLTISFFQLILIVTALGFSCGLMLDFKWPNPDPNIIHFPHESSCHHYYLVLSEEDVEIRRCPDEYIFDYLTHKCSRNVSAKCWSRHFEKFIHHHVKKHHKRHFRCPYTWGKYPDINDCKKYFVCLNNKATHKKCAPFESFDKVQGKCIAEIDAQCADKTDVIEHAYKCPRKWGSFVFSKDCSMYYECLEKKPVLRTCEHGTLFDGRRRKCIPKDDVTCASRHNPYEKETTHNPMIYSNENIARLTPQVVIDQHLKLVTDMRRKTPPTVQTTPVDENSILSQAHALSKDKVEQEFRAKSIYRSSSKGLLTTIGPTVESSPVDESTTEDGRDESQHSIMAKSTINLVPSESRNLETHPGTITEVTDTNEFVQVNTSHSAFTESSDLTKTHTKLSISTEIIRTPGDVDRKIDFETSTVVEAQGSSMAQQNISTRNNDIHNNCRAGDSRCIVEKDGRVLRCTEADGFYPHPVNERLYLHCENYMIHVRSCKGNTIYRPRLQLCLAAMIM